MIRGDDPAADAHLAFRLRHALDESVDHVRIRCGPECCVLGGIEEQLAVADVRARVRVDLRFVGDSGEVVAGLDG